MKKNEEKEDKEKDDDDGGGGGDDDGGVDGDDGGDDDEYDCVRCYVLTQVLSNLHIFSEDYRQITDVFDKAV